MGKHCSVLYFLDSLSQPLDLENNHDRKIRPVIPIRKVCIKPDIFSIYFKSDAKIIISKENRFLNIVAIKDKAILSYIAYKIIATYTLTRFSKLLKKIGSP